MFQKIQNTLSGVEGVGIYGVISIVIFFVFFTGMLLWAATLKKNHLNNMSTLPLESGERPNSPADKLQS